ncbi:hypothetical protein [Gryllotalpicola koreensis]|uniref:Uncharacterized protein n=1 Tax=Gryllotalpicola koreensis TaxID=993086 RepID=A0ABP7ZQY8_9MICO
MTDAEPHDASPGIPSPLPSIYLHPLANPRALRARLKPIVGAHLARGAARAQRLTGLAAQFFVWGFVGGIVVVIIGIVLWGADSGPALGATLGFLVLMTGVVLYYCGLGARRSAVTRLLQRMRSVDPAATRSTANALYNGGPTSLARYAREHPGVFLP